MAIATILGSAALVAGIGLTISSAWLITMAAQHPPILVLSVSIVMVRFFGISRSAARYAERVMSHESVFRNLTALRVRIFESLNNRASLIIQDLNSGSYVKAIVDDVERAQEYQLRVTLPRYVAFASIGFSTILALWIYPTSLLIFTPIALALLLLIPTIVGKKCISLSSRIEDLENRYAREISDAKYSIAEAQIYGYQERLVRELHGVEDGIYLAEKELNSLTRSLQFLTLLLIGTAITGVSLLLYQTQSTNSLPAVKISMAIFLPLVAFEGITNWFPNLFVSGKLLRAQQSVDSLAKSRKIENHSISKFPSAFEVDMNSATVSWDKTFMTPVNAKVKPGEILVLRGKSGSGKSTLALGLLGLLPYSGSISIGGIQIREISTPYKYVSASLQHGHIFNTSLRENLKIANSDVTDEEILRMLKILELNHIALDEILGEFGRPLSGGEAKRLGVARALLSKTPIIILDEPTEHLDAQLAERLETRISAECQHRALIVITHSGWAKCTRTVSITRE